MKNTLILMIVIASAVPAAAFETREECIKASSFTYGQKDDFDRWANVMVSGGFPNGSSADIPVEQREVILAKFEELLASFEGLAEAIADACSSYSN